MNWRMESYEIGEYLIVTKCLKMQGKSVSHRLRNAKLWLTLWDLQCIIEREIQQERIDSLSMIGEW